MKLNFVRLSLLFLLAAALQGNSSQLRHTAATGAALAESAHQYRKPAGSAKTRATKQRKAGAAPNMNTVPESSWGGQHISLSVGKNSTAIEYDCAHGTIDQRVELDKDGRFEALGMYEEEQGGPSQNISARDEDGTLHPETGRHNLQEARYTGRITGQKMTLTVTLIKTNHRIGTFQLIKDATPRLRKCL
jgi:hypothetical protein